jgi:NADH oxidase (H2O2-forming)
MEVGPATFKMKVIIIGGGSAGTTCAFELRKLNKEIEITILEKSPNLEYSPCALPYVLSGEIKSFENIFLFSKKDYYENKINLLLNSKVERIDIKKKKVILTNEKEMFFDKLVLAIGSSVFIPKIEGLEKSCCRCFKTIEDAKDISRITKTKTNSIIIGAGLIGTELAFSLSNKGNRVSIIEEQENILSNILDSDMSEKVKEELEKRKIKIFEKYKIKKVSNKRIVMEEGEIKFDNLFLCTGVKPNTSLAEKAKLKIGKGIIVNNHLETSNKNIYACGDCVEYFEFNTSKKILSQLGTTAVRQAKVIARNILGKKEKFPPILKNTISKIGNLYFGTVGITQKRAKELNIKNISAKYSGPVRAEYYSEKERISIKIVCNTQSEIIGAQIVGNCEVVGRLNMIALAIQKRIKLQDISKLETCYNPAAVSIFDPLTIVADICLKKLNCLK